MKGKKSVWLLLCGSMMCAQFVVAQPVSISEPTVCYPPQINWSRYEWMLIGGGKRPACQEMLQHLRSQPDDAPPPVCLRERLPQNINWTRPDWKVLPPEEREALLKGAPPSARKLVTQLRNAKEWKVVRMDVTQDDEPETLLAFGEGSADCHKVTRCAVPEGPMKGYISLTSAAGGNTALLAMSDDGKRIKFHQSREKPLTKYGELVFYKGRPYWISPLRWEQKVHDDYVGHAALTDPRNKKNRMFQIAPVKHRYTQKNKRPTDDQKNQQGIDFKNVYSMLPDPSAACYFGYFHRGNLK